jgi:hypothetical protein
MLKRLLRQWRKTPTHTNVVVPYPLRTMLDPGHEVVHAFDFKGEAYWKFSNEYNLPFERMQAAMGILEELEMGVDKHFLQAVTQSVKEQLEKGKLSEAWKWLHELDERLSWPIDADHVYRLAAVTFMQAHENPYAYDPMLARKKIDSWRTQDKDAELLRSFFLKLGLMHYLGPLTDADIALPDYTAAQRQVKLKQLSALCTQLYAQAKTTDWYNSIKLEASALKTLQQ